MTTPTPWAIAAGALYAKAEAELASPDQLTRLAGEARLGMAKAELAACLAAVAHLKACLALEPAA